MGAVVSALEALRAAAQLAAEVGAAGPIPRTTASLRANGLPLRIAGTPVMLRLVNASGFAATAVIDVAAQPLAGEGLMGIWIDTELRTQVRGSIVHGTTSHTFPVDVTTTTPGRVLASWFLHQEATRRKPKGGQGSGPAHFRFELFIPEEV